MALWKIVTLACTASIIVNAKSVHHKRDAPSSICDPDYNNTSKIQCYCTNDRKDPSSIGNADCYLTQQNVAIDDKAWTRFKTLKNVHRINFLNTRGISLTYVPTEALKETTELEKLEIKYGIINTIGTFAFANLTSLETITLSDNQIIALDPYAFVNHKHLKSISLDTNGIIEINRNVFVDLPSLEKLYLTNNQISTIHDRAFVNLINLKELEIDRNKVFSLNFAVFEGLSKLEKLDISSNSLEVIGDDTFLALENLEMLNLDGNNIQMLDDKAFNGLGKLQSLSLAHNKLTNIDSDKVFDGLNSLMVLNMKANQLKELKNTAMQPILNNFYGNSSSLDVEDNNFPCDCRLDWFISLMNKTQNKYLKITIENLKCMPDANLRETWNKIDKSTPPALEEEETQAQGNDYEYYDDTQLNGRLFYVDVRDLLNCSINISDETETNANLTAISQDNASSTIITAQSTNTVTDENIPDSSTFDATTGVSTDSTTTTVKEVSKSDKNRREKNNIEQQEAFTTTRLATVSAKPVEAKIYDNMASDEAKPEKINSHRSTQEAPGKVSRRIEEDPKSNHANKNLGCVMMLILTVVCSRLHF